MRRSFGQEGRPGALMIRGMPRHVPRPIFDTLDNPESAYTRIKALQKEYGGWTKTIPLNPGSYTYHVILRGPYTGVYELYGNRVKYGTYSVPHDDKARMLGETQVAVIASGIQPPYPDDLVVWRAANVLYVLSEVGGVPLEKVVLDLRAVPKRILSVITDDPIHGYLVLKLPTQQRDRVLFSKAFLSTWSVEKALRACLPTIEGRVPLSVLGTDVAKAKALLHRVPSWKQHVPKMSEMWEVQEKTSHESLLEHGLWRALRKAQTLRKHGYSRSAIRDILTTLSKHEVDSLNDVLWVIPKTLEPLAETPEGRRIIDQAEKREWKKLLRQHDFIVELYRVRGKKPITEAAALKFHAGARKFNLPAGVTPLTTREEFETEGREMEHCVAGYFWQRKSYCFSLKGKDGCRATLEWNLQHGPVQYMGERHTAPGPGCAELKYALFRGNAHRIP